MIREINPEGRTGERCSASQYVNKYVPSILAGTCLSRAGPS